MTRDDIIRMAHEAGMEQEELVFYSPYDDEYDVHIDHLEAFANIVAAAEREACAKVCSQIERAEHYSKESKLWWSIGASECEAAIRARGQE